MDNQGKKYAEMLATLAIVAEALQAKADVYGTLNSQDADYRSLQQQVGAVLALPDDQPSTVVAAPVPAPIVYMSADQVEEHMVSILTAIHESQSEILAALVPAAQ